jgi:dual specificity phosphatase 3
MTTLSLPMLHRANAHFVTPQLLVGGDLSMHDPEAADQLDELVTAGVTHVVDVRIEADDSQFVAAFAPDVTYLHHGVDDRGQRIPATWFDRGVDFAVDAIEHGRVVLTHCHMGINRGPSLGYAVLLHLGWDPVEALSAIRAARPIAYVDYARDALRWHHERVCSSPSELVADLERLRQWRQDHHLDVVDVIRRVRLEDRG